MRLSIAPAPQLPIERYSCSAGSNPNITNLSAINNMINAWSYGAASNVNLAAGATNTPGTSTSVQVRLGVPYYTTATVTNANIYKDSTQTFQIQYTGTGSSINVTGLTLSNIYFNSNAMSEAQFASNLSVLTALTSLSLNYIKMTTNAYYFTSVPLSSCGTNVSNLTVTMCGMTAWTDSISTSYPNLVMLNLSNNSFNPSPTWTSASFPIAKLSNLTLSSIGMTNFPTLTQCTHLTSLTFSGNTSLPSFIPASIPTSITTITADNCNFNMSLPSFSSCTSLTTISFKSSNISGGITTSLFPSSITSILLTNNKISGQLPNFSSFTHLLYLYLDNNSLNGALNGSLLPPSIGGLYLSRNQFSGPLINFSSFTHLMNLYLDNNNLTGSIDTGVVPAIISKLSLANNQFTGPFPVFTNTFGNMLPGFLDVCSNSFFTSLPSGISVITACWQDAPNVTLYSQDKNGVTFTVPSSTYAVVNFTTTGYIHIFKNNKWIAVKSTGTTYTDTYSDSNKPEASDVYAFYLTPYNFSSSNFSVGTTTITTLTAALVFYTSGSNQNVTYPKTITVTPTLPVLTVTLLSYLDSDISPVDISADTPYNHYCVLPSFSIKNNANYSVDVYSQNPDSTWKSLGTLGANQTGVNGTVSMIGIISNGIIGLDNPVYRINGSFGSTLSSNFRYVINGTSATSTGTVSNFTFYAAAPTVFTDTPTVANQITITYLAAINEIIDGYFTCSPTTSTTTPNSYIAGDMKFYDTDPTVIPTPTPFHTIFGFTAAISNFTIPYNGTVLSGVNTIYVTFGNSLSTGAAGVVVVTATIIQDCQSIPTPSWTTCPVLDQCGTTGTQTSPSVTLATTDLNGGYSCQQRVTDYNAANSTNLTYNAGTVSYSKTCNAPACPGNFSVTASNPSTTGFTIQITLPSNNPSIPAGDSYKIVLYNSAGAVFPVLDAFKTYTLSNGTSLSAHWYDFSSALQSIYASLTTGTTYSFIAKLFEVDSANTAFNTSKQASFSFTVPQNCILPAVPPNDWSGCNSSCGPGAQTQNVNIDTQRVGTGTSCSAATVPVGVTALVNSAGTVVTYTRSCTSASCGTICNIGTPATAAGSWTTCSVADHCGTSGTQTQAVTATFTATSTPTSTSCSSLVTAYNSAYSGRSATYDPANNIVTYTQSCNSIPCPQSMTIVQSTTTLTTTSNAYVDITLTYASAAPSLPAGETLEVDVLQYGGFITTIYGIITNGTSPNIRIRSSFLPGATYHFTGTLFEKTSANRFNTGISAQFTIVVPQDCVLPTTSLGTWSACTTDNTVCASTGTAGTKTMTLPITTPAVGTGTACSATTKPSGVSSMTFSGTDVTYTAACTSLVCPTVTITVTNSSTSSVTFTATTTSTFVNTYNVIITGWQGAASVTIPLTNPASSANASFAWPAGQTYNNNGNITITAMLKETIGTGAPLTTSTSLTVPSFTIPSDCVVPSLNISTNAWYCQDSTHTKKACGSAGSFYQESTLTQASGSGQTCTTIKAALTAPPAGITRGYITKNGSEYVTYTQACSVCPSVTVSIVYMGLNLKLISTLTITDTNSYYIVYSGFPSATPKTTSLMSSSSTSNNYMVSDTQWHQGSTGTVTYNLYELNSSPATPSTDFLVSTGSVAYTFPTDCQITMYNPGSWSTCPATLCGTSDTVTQTQPITPATTGGLGCDAVLTTKNIPAGITASINGTTITYTQACSAIACPGGLALVVDPTYPVTLVSAHIDVDFGGSGFTVQFRDSNETVLTTSVLTPSTTNIVNVNTTSLNLTKGQTFTLTAYIYQTGFMSTPVANGNVQVHVPNDCVVTPVSDSLWENCSTANPANCGYCTAVASACGATGIEYEYQSYTPADAGGSCPSLPTGAIIVGNEIQYSRPCSTTGCVIANPGIDSIVFTIPAVTGDTIYVSPTPFTKDSHGKVTSFADATSFVVGATPGLSYTTATTTYTATGLSTNTAYTYYFQNSSSTYPTSATATTGVATITPTLGTVDPNNITVNVTASYISDPVTNSTSAYTLSIVSGGVATTTAHINVPLNGQSSYTFTNMSLSGYSGNYQIIAKLYDVNFRMGDSSIATSNIYITSQDCVMSDWGTCDCGTSLQTRTITSEPINFGQACGDLQQACTPSGCEAVTPAPKQCNGICWLCWFYFIMIAYLLR